MLLVDDDQAEIVDRREHRRARAHADARLALAQAPPLGVALGGAQPRVQHRDGVAEALDEARDDLRGERDLRHQHDRAAALLERGRGGLQVDLGLARAGHAVQQPPLGPALREAPRSAARAPPAGRRSARGSRGPALPDARRCAAAATARRLRPLSRRAAPGGSTSVERARDRRAVLGGDPLAPARPARRARRARAARSGASSRSSATLAAVGESHHHAEHLAPAEGHHEHRADVHPAAQLLGQPVVKRPAQRAGRRHRLDLGDRWHLGADTRPRPGQLTGRRRRAARPSCRSSPT